MKIFFKLLQLVSPVFPTMLFSVLLAFCSIASSISLMAAAAFLIASAALHPQIHELSLAIVAVRFFGISRAIFRYGERYMSHNATFRILTRLRVWCYRKLEPLAPAKLDQWQSGELFSLLVHHIDTLKDFYLRVLAPPVTALCILLVLAGALTYFVPLTAIILILSFLLIGLVIPLLIYHLNNTNIRLVTKDKAAFKNHCIDTIKGITELTAFHYAPAKLLAIQTCSARLAAREDKAFRITALTDAAAGFLANFTLWLILLLLVPLVNLQQITGIGLAVCVLVIQSSFEAVLLLPAVWYYYSDSMQSAKELFAIVESEPPLKEMPYAAPMHKKSPYLLTFNQVHFAYQPKEEVLTGLSFTLRAGERIAIVGASGAGKSTLVNLLLRFWDYSSGDITLNGLSYRTLNAEDIRANFNVVTQSTHIFHCSLKENLRLVHPSATDSQIHAALQKAQLGTFIESLPEGLDTDAGQNGKLLSGGQRQRLALARALLNPAPLMLLDEPTAGLDAITECKIMETIEQNLAGRALLLITHKLNGLEKMDKILVLANGEIAEQGTFVELLKRQGLFYQMWRYKRDF